MSVTQSQLVVLGGGGVGKSAVTVQFTSFHFVELYDPTIEDTYTKSTLIDGEPTVLSILDTAGQEEYVGMRDEKLEKGEGFLLIYSILDRVSFQELFPIKEQISRVRDFEKVPMVLVGNKADLDQERRISFEEGEELARTFNVPFFEVSAKSRLNIENAFFQLVREIKIFRKIKEKAFEKTWPKKKKDKCILS